MKTAAASVTFDDIRHLIGSLPGSGEAAGRDAKEDLAVWLARWQRRDPPTVDRPRIAIYAALHGGALEPADELRALAAAHIERITGGEADVHALCGELDADLRLYEMAPDQPARDFADGAALAEDDCAHAIAYGMMAVEDGVDVLGLGAISPGGDIAAAAIGLALATGNNGDPARLQEDAAVRRIEAALAFHEAALTDRLEVLRCLGGQDVAALLGAMIAARMAGTPVVFDGPSAVAAALLLGSMTAGGADHCRLAQRTGSALFDPVAAAAGWRPLIDLGVSRGDGEGAARAIALLRDAVAAGTGPQIR